MSSNIVDRITHGTHFRLTSDNSVSLSAHSFHACIHFQPLAIDFHRRPTALGSLPKSELRCLGTHTAVGSHQQLFRFKSLRKSDMNTETNNSPAYFPGLDLPPADNTPPATKREWMDIPWKERNILSKICYVIASAMAAAVGLFILWLIASVALNLLGKALGPWATQNLGNNWWVWPFAIFLFWQRCFCMTTSYFPIGDCIP